MDLLDDMKNNPDLYPATARKFIFHVIRLVQGILSRERYSLFIFGSLNTRDHSRSEDGTSDVDLLLIIDDDVPQKINGRLWKVLNSLEYHYFYRMDKTLVGAILRSVERQTGMHENIFIVKRKDFLNLRFSRMFRTNRILSSIFAPKTIVIGSALSHIEYIAGKADAMEIISQVKNKIGTGDYFLLPDVIKSILMNVVLSLSSIFLLPLSKRSTRYSIEAIKWSMYATTYYLTGSRPKKDVQKRVFEKLGIPRHFLNTWLYLSEHYARHVRFSLNSFRNVLRIHCLGLRIKRLRLKVAGSLGKRVFSLEKEI
ncbi:MAG: hypothetical protein ACTSUE_00990 [Promethearchaeota archaeon]